MKLKVILDALAVMLSAKTFVQSANAHPSLSIGLEAGIPAPDCFSHLYNFDLGGSAKGFLPNCRTYSVCFRSVCLKFVLTRLIMLSHFSFMQVTIRLSMFSAPVLLHL